MQKLLIVDDEPNVLYSFRKGLSSEAVAVTTAETGHEAIHLVQQGTADAVILDVRLPDMSGLEAFDRIRQLDPRLPVIIVTAHSTTETAIDAMKRGAFDYLLKPVDVYQLRSLVAKALELSLLQHSPSALEASVEDEDAAEGVGIVGRSPAMQEVYKSIGRVAREDVTVLILGESGTGKELIARAIRHHSRRRDGPFLAINCAALPEPLLESELFGHERGAFTGAERRRIGKFEQAHGGTLFLDEVGDMAPATQAKVLRVLQDGQFERVGGNQTIATDVRILAATNQDLEAKIRADEFREDLLYRLNGFTLRLPPLRERLNDLPLLVENALRLSNQEVTKPARSVAPETMRLLESYHWPGNVRELQSVIKYAVVHAVSDVITPECLPEPCRRRRGSGGTAQAGADELLPVADVVRRLLQTDTSGVYRQLLTRIDRVILTEVMQHVRGNQVHASQCLGISRTTLRSKLSSLGLDADNFDGL